jgi:hypothetical protein
MNRALSAAAASALALFLAAGAAGLLASCGEEKPPAKIEYLTVAYPAITEAPEDLPRWRRRSRAVLRRIGSNVRLVPFPGGSSSGSSP